MMLNGNLGQISVEKNLENEDIDCIIFSHDPPRSDDAKILLLNCRESLLGIFQKIFSNDFRVAQISTNRSVLGIFHELNGNSIHFVVLDVRPNGPDLTLVLKLVEILNSWSIRLCVIVCSEWHAPEVVLKFPELEEYDLYCLEVDDVKGDPQIIRKLFNEFIKPSDNDVLQIDDFWILEYLNQTRVFKEVGLSFEPFLELDRLKKEIELHKKEDYSIWFGGLYNEIMNRFNGIFRQAGLDYIADSIDNFVLFERLLYLKSFYAPQKRYRDHFLHQMRIALLGDFFLNLYLDENTRLIDLVNDILLYQEEIVKFTPFKSGDRQNTLKTCNVSWLCIALMHDCSYPLNWLYESFFCEDESREKLLKAFTSDLILPMMESHEYGMIKLGLEFKKKIPSFLNELKVKEQMRKVIKKTERAHLNHSITSSYNFLKLYKQQSQKNRIVCPGLVAQSILLHHPFSGSFEHLHFNEHPLAFLLVLLDEIQDWGRPCIMTDEQNDPTRIVAQSIDLSKIEIEGISRDKMDHTRFNLDKDEVKIFLNYEKNNNLPSGVISNIINAKKANLERLDIGTEKFPNITVCLKFKGWEWVEIPIKKRKK